MDKKKRNDNPFRVKKVGKKWKYDFVSYDEWEKMMNKKKPIDRVYSGRTIVNRVYQIDQLIALFGDVIEDYVNQVVLMSDEELKEDRSGWLKRYGDYYDKDEYIYDTSIHTIAIEIEQIRRWQKIIYDIPKKNVRLD